MSTVSLKCELLEDDELVEYKIELADDEETQPEECDTNTTDVGRVVLDLEKNSWSFKCFFCELSFIELSQFKEHVNNVHIVLPCENDEWETGSSNYEITNLDITPTGSVKEEVIEEEHLDESITSSLYEDNGASCTEANRKTKPIYPHKCEFCEKTFRYRSKLRDHLTVHTGELPYKCDQCNKAFRSSDVLRFHRAIHSNEKSIKCHHCDLSFNQKRYLQMHLKYHLGGQTFSCTVCGKTHRTSSQLKVHMLRHTSNKEYICEICGACYRLRQHLVIHLKQKHENKRDFKCDECDKAFNTIGFLNNHKLSHSKKRNHICNVCGMGFVWRKNLQEHIKLHTGTKNHKCDVCGKAFAQKSGLISHMKTHTS